MEGEKQDRRKVVNEILCSFDVKCNLAIMVIIWASCTSNSYSLYYLTNTYEEVYKTAISLNMASFAGCILSAFMTEFLGPKKTIFYSYLTAICGGLLILFYGLDH